MAERKSAQDSGGGKKKRSAAEIAEAELPGWKAVPDDDELSDAAAQPEAPASDAVLPSMGALRKKYLGEEPAAADAVERAAPLDDVEVVTLKSGPVKKKVGVKGGKVVWYQG